MPAMMAGKSENRHQIIDFTDSKSVIVTMVSPVVGSVPDSEYVITAIRDDTQNAWCRSETNAHPK